MSAPRYEDKSLYIVYYFISYFLATAVHHTQIALCNSTQLLCVRLSQIYWVYCFTNHWVTSRIPKTVIVTSGTVCTALCSILFSRSCLNLIGQFQVAATLGYTHGWIPVGLSTSCVIDSLCRTVNGPAHVLLMDYYVFSECSIKWRIS